MMLWPTCSKCDRTILVHYLRGARAYCRRSWVSPTGHAGRWRYSAADLSSFTVAEVNRVNIALGNSLSAKARELEAKATEKAAAR